MLGRNSEIERLYAEEREAEKLLRLANPLGSIDSYGYDVVKSVHAELELQRKAQEALGSAEMIRQIQTAASVTQTYMRDLHGHTELVRQMRDIVDYGKVVREAVAFPDLSKQMREVLDVGRHVRESLAALDMGRQMADALDIGRHVREAVAAIDYGKPFREMSAVADAARTIAGSTLLIGRQVEEALAAIDFGKQAREALAVLDVGRQLQDSVLAAVRRADLTSQLHSVKTIADTFASLSRDRWPELFEDVDDFQVDAGGSVRLGARTVSHVELQEVVTGIVERSVGDSNKQLAQLLGDLIMEIKKLKDPWYEKLLLHFVYPLLIAIAVAVVTVFAERYLSERPATDERNLKKQIKQEVAATVGKESLQSFRFVTASHLHVRLKDSSRSAVIGTLRFGQAVELIKKERDWSLIRWAADEEGVMVQGWVFSRYLSKFH